MWKYANTQWALYPNGGCISTGGAVLPAWVLTAPFIRLTLMPVTESSETPTCFRTRLSVAWRVFEEALHSRGCSHSPLFLKEIKHTAHSLTSSHFPANGPKNQSKVQSKVRSRQTKAKQKKRLKKKNQSKAKPSKPKQSKVSTSLWSRPYRRWSSASCMCRAALW